MSSIKTSNDKIKNKIKKKIKKKIKNKILCNKCSFKSKLSERYEGRVGDYLHVHGIYRCFSGHTQDRIIKISVIENPK